MKAGKAGRRSASMLLPDMKQNAGFSTTKVLDPDQNMHYYA